MLKQNYYGLTGPQKNIWNTELFYNNSNINSVCGTAIINEIVDFDLLKKAINIIVEQNDALRTRIILQNNIPVQFFSDYVPFDIEIIDVSNKNDISKVEQEIVNKRFNILSSNLFIAALLRFPDGTAGVILNGHHIITDSWSLGLTIKEIMKLYHCLKNNVEYTSNTFSYSEYINSESNYKSSKRYKADKEFWSDFLRSLPEPVTIPGLVNSSTSSSGKRISFNLEKNLCDLINEYCKNNNISSYVFFMSVYALYIANITNSLDFIIGTPILNRTNFKEKNSIGMFVETIPFRFSIDPAASFKDLIMKTSLDLMSILRHQKYSYTDILNDLRKNDNEIPNLYNIAISYQITKAVSSDIGNYETRWNFNNNSLNDINIHLYDLNDTGALKIDYDYLNEKYSNHEIINIHKRILHIIEQILKNKEDIKLKDIKIITNDELDMICNINKTSLNYPTERVDKLISNITKKFPNNIAVVDENEKITYMELEKRSNIIADKLIKFGIQEHDIVSIYMSQKSVNLICSILGILKVGASFLAIYSEYPIDRIQYMLEDSKSKCLIFDNAMNDKVDLLKEHFAKLSYINSSNIDFNIDTNINIENFDINSTAYIIYTSGSTGKPKGVALSHKNLLNFIYNFRNHLQNIFSNDKFLSVTNICFDVSISEIFTPLVFGASLYLYKDLNYSTPKELAEYIVNNNITFSYFPPALLSHVYKELKNYENVKLNKLLVGVEPIKASTLSNFLKINPKMKIVNGYGPTETTICCTMYDFNNSLPSDSIVPIGRPLANNKIHVFNKFMNYMPYNSTGTLWISGDGVGNGYIGEASKVQNSFQTINNVKFYNTGDLVRLDEDNILHFVGRKDNQIKFHGYRIDIGEIESSIRKYKNVHNCIVTLNKINNVDKLIAFICSSKDINEFDIRTYISNILPHYMIPNIFIFLPTFPLTPNGKIDKKALFELSNTKTTIHNSYIEPKTYTEKVLAQIFSNILDIPNISINDNFFELGGDSLSAIKVISEIETKLNIKVMIKDIFNFPTISALSSFINQKVATDNKNTISKAPIAKFYPLSFAQKRIYYTVKLNESQTVYNTPFGILFDKLPDLAKLEQCFNTLINRHQSLRTYFEIEKDEVVQKIKENISFKLDVLETTNQNIEEIFDEFIKPFDLSVSPLFRAKFIKSNKLNILLIDMHHIICDGQSSSIFADELCKLYNGENLRKEDIDYIDYSVWENNYSKTQSFDNSKTFWVNSFKNGIPVLNMPIQKSRPKTQSFKGQKIYGEILNIEKLFDICKKLNTTPYMFLLSLYYVLLYKYTNQDEYVVGSPIVGRDNSQVSNILGMFVNTLPLKATINSSISFKEFLSNVMDNCIKAFENQSYPFDEIVKNLDISRDASNTPLFNTMFTYQNNGVPKLELNDVSVKYFIPDNKTSKFDFSLEISPKNSCLKLSLEYCTDLFEQKFMEDFLKHYINIFNYVVTHDLNVLIKDISILSEEEKHMLIYDYNNTYIEYPKDKTIVELFEEKVKESYSKNAIVFEDKSITYAELNEKSNQIARFLRKKGIKPNDVVGIMLNRSIELVTCMMGILKAGGAYLPIDPTYPEDRINYIIKDSNVNILLTSSNLSINNANNIETVNVDFGKSSIYDLPVQNLNIVNNPDDLAYLIYTSGSTGNPKGVMLTHKNVNNFIAATCNKIEFKNIMVSVTTFCFDIFVLESLLPLQKGLTIVLANEEEQNIPQKLNELCLKYNVEMLQTTPSRMSLLISDESSIEYIKNLKVLMLGGEPLPVKLLKDLKKLTKSKIYNMYGPTETTVWSSIKDLTNTNCITIGGPIGNTQFYILDKDRNLVSDGIEGSLFIGGDGVAKGYLHREDLTNEKFISNPYIENDIIYDTGDIAKWIFNKEMICIGRSDFQVKLRGLRIELSEIENRIMQFPHIDKTVVCIKHDTLGRDFLCAYFVSRDRVSIPELKDFLSKFLPTYMVPNKFKQLSDFRYTPNGKIDKKALPDIELHTSDNNIILASTPTEKKLAKIYEELLGISPISINDNFFEIGGDSMLALKLQIKLLNDNTNITYSDIFKYNTIKQLAKKIDTRIANHLDKIEEYDFTKINNLLSVNNIQNLQDLKRKNIGNIILTGATGFLGAHILSYILDNTNLKVYCLLRPDLSIDINTKLTKRLRYYFGDKYDKYLGNRFFAISSDITRDGLGLDINTIDLLNKNSFCVINSAAIVKHYGDYADFEQINVKGVKNLASFCIKYNKKLIQISTVSVSGNTLFDLAINNNNFANDVEFNETNLYIGQSLENVYVRSKFEAEKIILESMLNYNLKALILRIGNITNRSTDGKFQPNSNENAFSNRLKAFIDLKCMPLYLKDIYVEFSPVDNVAEAVCKSLYYSDNINVLHIYNSNHVYMKDLIGLLPDNTLEFVDNYIFDKKLNMAMKEANNTNSISFLVNDLDDNKHISYDNNIKIKNTFTNVFLDKIGFKWSDINKNYMSQLLKNI